MTHEHRIRERSSKRVVADPSAPQPEPSDRPRIWASVLDVPLECLRDTVAALDATGIHGYHLDIMDGHFVPNLSVGVALVDAMTRLTTRPLDVHLMASCLDVLIQPICAHRVERLHVHVEATNHLHRWGQIIVQSGVQVSVAVNPQTSVWGLDAMWPFVSGVLVMSVNPGFGGQSLIRNTYDKLRAIERSGFEGVRMVDGGVNEANLVSLCRAGATDLVMGSALIGGGIGDIQARVNRCEALIDHAIGSVA